MVWNWLYLHSNRRLLLFLVLFNWLLMLFIYYYLVWRKIWFHFAAQNPTKIFKFLLLFCYLLLFICLFGCFLIGDRSADGDMGRLYLCSTFCWLQSRRSAGTRCNSQNSSTTPRRTTLTTREYIIHPPPPTPSFPEKHFSTTLMYAYTILND